MKHRSFSYEEDRKNGRILTPGSKIGKYEQFEIVRHLGSGAFAHAYLAKQQGNGLVAIKMMRLELVHQEASNDVKHRMAQEVDIGQMFTDSRHVVGGYEMGYHEGAPYIVMSFVEDAQSLLDMMNGEEEIYPETAIRIIIGIAESVNVMHSMSCMCVHRDLKPENVLINTRGEVFVLDLGLATRLMGQNIYNTQLIAPGQVGGTPVYMARTQWAGKDTIRADVYSMSIMLYQLLTGEVPWENANKPLKIAAAQKARAHFAVLEQRIKDDPELGMFYDLLEAGFMSGEIDPPEEQCLLTAQSLIDGLKQICSRNFPMLWQELEAKEEEEGTKQMDLDELRRQAEAQGAQLATATADEHQEEQDPGDTQPQEDSQDPPLPPGMSTRMFNQQVAPTIRPMWQRPSVILPVAAVLLVMMLAGAGGIFIFFSDSSPPPEKPPPTMTNTPTTVDKSEDAGSPAAKVEQDMPDEEVVPDTEHHAEAEEDAAAPGLTAQMDASPDVDAEAPPNADKAAPPDKPTKPVQVRKGPKRNGAKKGGGRNTQPANKKPRDFLSDPGGKTKPKGSKKKPKSFLD